MLELAHIVMMATSEQRRDPNADFMMSKSTAATLVVRRL
jgi:hypothetical protein